MWYYNFVHHLGLHSYSIPTVLTALIAFISLYVHSRKQKKREEEFEEELEELKGGAAEAASPAK